MLARAALAFVVALATARVAVAETVVLVAPPPALEQAVRSSLAPWRIEVVVVDAKQGAPEALAAAEAAGFVAWREDGDLVFWDTARAHRERRPMAAHLDDAGAAALALSIKTWMRLGPPPSAEPPEGPDRPDLRDAPTPLAAAPPPPLIARVRADVALGVRYNLGEHGMIAPRAALAVLYGVAPVEVGLLAETGTSYQLTEGETTTWSHHALAAHARWPFGDPTRLALAPNATLGILRTTARGTNGPQNQGYAASATGVWLDAGVIAERRWGYLSAALDLGVGVVPASQELKDRSVKLTVPAHLEPRALIRLGLVIY